jgi:pyruvate dehydrogenase E2 component (dihydrolipoamide acetyltransferase)
MIEFKMPSLGADMEDGTLIGKKSQATRRKRGDIIEVETQKDLSKLRYSMKASLINSSFRKETKYHGTAERRFFRYKKEKRSCPIATNQEKQKYAPAARLKYEK